MTNHRSVTRGARTFQWGYTKHLSMWGVERMPNGVQLNVGRVYVRWSR